MKMPRWRCEYCVYSAPSEDQLGLHEIENHSALPQSQSASCYDQIEYPLGLPIESDLPMGQHPGPWVRDFDWNLETDQSGDLSKAGTISDLNQQIAGYAAPLGEISVSETAHGCQGQAPSPYTQVGYQQPNMSLDQTYMQGAADVRSAPQLESLPLSTHLLQAYQQEHHDSGAPIGDTQHLDMPALSPYEQHRDPSRIESVGRPSSTIDPREARRQYDKIYSRKRRARSRSRLNAMRKERYHQVRRNQARRESEYQGEGGQGN